jgi:hypothetical protein
MTRRPVANPELSDLGRFQGTIDRGGNFRQQAFNHNLGRNVRVLKVLACFGLLRQAGRQLAGSIECKRAEPQNFSSPQDFTRLGILAGHTEAAHFLPGVIWVGGRELWQLVIDPGTRDRVEFLFAEVEHLPVQFNQADTQAEAKGRPGGLCAALATACKKMATEPIIGDPPNSPLPTALIKFAYESWCKDSKAAFENAGDAKRGPPDRPNLPPLRGNPFDGYTAESVGARSTAPNRFKNRDIAARVLDVYLEDQQEAASVLGRSMGQLREFALAFKP